MLIKISALAVLILIAYQDFRYREIHIALFLMVSVFFFIDGQSNMPFLKYLLNVSYNMIFVLAQFLFVYVFYAIRGYGFKSLATDIIGTGDILFIVILSLAFPWQSFFLYYIGGLVFTLLIWLLLKYSGTVRNKLIPFAGLLSVYCALLLVFEFLLPDCGRFDSELLKLLLHG